MNRSVRPGKRTYGALTALVSAIILFSVFAGIAAADDSSLVSGQGLPEAGALPVVTTSTVSVDTTYAPLAPTVVATPTPAPAATAAPVVTKPVTAVSKPKPKPKKPARKEYTQIQIARTLLRKQIALHPILKGTTVSFGATPNNYQAVAYYTTGHIVINPNHRASLSRIVAHEVWHVIDWRDNGRIDWGEHVPR